MYPHCLAIIDNHRRTREKEKDYDHSNLVDIVSGCRLVRIDGSPGVRRHRRPGRSCRGSDRRDVGIPVTQSNSYTDAIAYTSAIAYTIADTAAITDAGPYGRRCHQRVHVSHC